MLLRFDALEEIGRFAKLKHKGEPFTPLTLVYGRNGYGKSTLCAILRSLSAGNPNPVFAHRRLQALKETRIQTSWDPAQTIAFSGGKWHSPAKQIFVFDQEYVHQNLHVGDSVTRDHKRRLLPVVLGKESVTLAQRITALDQEQRELDTSIRRDASIIRAAFPVIGADAVSAYCGKDLPADLNEHISNAEKSLQLARQSYAVQTKKVLAAIILPPISVFRELAARTLASVSVDVTRRVKEHVEAHSLLPPSGDRWLKYGLDHVRDSHCPFCAQPLAGVDLIEAYSSYFSDAFAQLSVDRDSAISCLDALLSNNALGTLVGDNDTDLLFWIKVCSLPKVPSLTDSELASIIDGLQALHQILQNKISNPLLSIEFGSYERSIQKAFDLVSLYNSALAKCTAVINVAKTEARNSDLTKAEKTHNSWLAFAAKQHEPLKGTVSSYITAERRLAAIEGEKKAAQSALTTFASRTMATRQSAINALLFDFGTSFSIVDAKANFKGREPNTEFAIEIGSRKVPAGEFSETQPSFKTVLSTGDKTTLALAFFITQITTDTDLDSSIVVFDDPFHSQDMNRQFETSSRIRAISAKARQTFVLSHDPRFLQLIEKDADHARTRTFQLLCTDSGDGSICAWSSADELKSLYLRQSEMIREYARRGNLLTGVTHSSVHQAMRPFLEDYLKARFPGRFNSLDQIVHMTETIRLAGTDDPMFCHVADLLALNEFTRPNMHGGGQIVDPDALRAQARKIVRIVGSY